MRTPARAAAALALLLAGCPARPDRDKHGPVHFVCEDGRRFAVLFDHDLARLVVGDDSVVLARVESASGARYTDGRITLFTKGSRRHGRAGRHHGVPELPRRAAARGSGAMQIR